MSNDELNRKVAALRGFIIRESQEECSAFTPGASWVSGGDYYEQIVVWCIPNAYIEAFDNCDDPHAEMDWFQYCGVPNYCDDPAMWGGLFMELQAEKLQPTIETASDGDSVVYLYHKPYGAPQAWAKDRGVGRALCLAYIAANEAENTPKST